MNKASRQIILAMMLVASMCVVYARAQDADPAAELAKKLANPVAAPISVPLQYNYDENYGADDKGSKSVLIIQPIVPFSLNENWNLIARTIATRLGYRRVGWHFKGDNNEDNELNVSLAGLIVGLGMTF